MTNDTAPKYLRVWIDTNVHIKDYPDLYAAYSYDPEDGRRKEFLSIKEHTDALAKSDADIQALLESLADRDNDIGKLQNKYDILAARNQKLVESLKIAMTVWTEPYHTRITNLPITEEQWNFCNEALAENEVENHKS